MAATAHELANVTLSLIAWLLILIVIFVPLELMFSVKRQKILRPSLLPDLGFFFLGGLIKAFVITIPVGIVVALARQTIPAGYFVFVGSLPMAVQIILGLIVGEIGFYWGHRAAHASPFLWRFHAVHHEAERMDWLINTRAHPIDLIVTRIFGLALVALAGLGAPGDHTNPVVPQLVLVFATIWAFFIHANVRWPMRWIEPILSTPRFHHWHHTRDEMPNHNFASMLPIFDRMFGTLHLPPKAWPSAYGIAPDNEPEAGVKADAAGPTKDVQSAQA